MEQFITPQNLRAYVVSRFDYLTNRVCFQYGYNTPSEIVDRLGELAALCRFAGLADLAEKLQTKADALWKFLPYQGTPKFTGFINAL